MEARIRALARVAAAAAVANESTVRGELLQALAAAVSGADLQELLLSSVLFIGYPRTINSLSILHQICKLAPPPPDDPPDLQRWRTRGEALFARIYGKNSERVRAAIHALHPDLAEWMVSDGYGKVLARSHLPAQDRELAVLGILAADSQERQLASHVRGAINVGATPAQVLLAITAVADLAEARHPGSAKSMLEVAHSILS